MKRKLQATLTLFCAALLLTVTAAAQNGEYESAASSNLTGVALPSGAQRIMPNAVPGEITQTLDKIIAAGSGKIRKGETEVLAWAGSNYSKANAGAIINRLTGTLAAAGWKYSVEGEESGVTVFSLFKEGAQRRAVVGFHGATDDALILSWMELHAAGGAAAPQQSEQSDAMPADDRTDDAPVGGGGGLVGTWTNGSTSMLGEKNMTTGVVTARNGSTFKWVFYPDGRFESIGLISSTMYGCTTTLFNDLRGRYQINGDQLTLIPSKNFWRNQYSCSPASNKERDYVLDRQVYTWRTKTNEYGKAMICLANAKGESCYERKAE